jgi:teichuronic acid biosynthesis glycosyltransferase TuaC
MKILTFSTLYPNAARPTHGIFVETRLRQLLASRQVETRVVAPVPWFPSTNARFGEYAAFASAPRTERRHDIEVLHPRYPVIPKAGMSLAPFLLAAAVAPNLRRLLTSGYDFELIDAHYFYPDGVAAAMLGRRFDKPVVITARGSDLNLIARHAVPRRLILWAARRAHAVITVSDALRRVAERIGIAPEKLTVLRNGVDTGFFRPVERTAVRAAHGLRGLVVLSVGHLVPAKGHDLVIEALARLPEAQLLIAGEGPEQSRLEQLALRRGVSGRVRFLGALSQERLVEYYGAADALVLASSREGWPNVLLESLACGTPVIASNVGGCAEVIAAPEAGVLLAERSAEAIARAVRELAVREVSREGARRYTERFSWAATTAGQLDLFTRVIAAREKRRQSLGPIEPQINADKRG